MFWVYYGEETRLSPRPCLAGPLPPVVCLGTLQLLPPGRWQCSVDTHADPLQNSAHSYRDCTHFKIKTKTSNKLNQFFVFVLLRHGLT